MKKNQDIKTLFRDQLEHFEVLPDAAVWSDIEKKLHEKKKRRVIPIWWFYGGIAAAFFVGLLINLNTNSGTISPETATPFKEDGVVQSSPSNSTNTNSIKRPPSQYPPLDPSEKEVYDIVNSKTKVNSLNSSASVSGFVNSETLKRDNTLREGAGLSPRNTPTASLVNQASNSVVTARKNTENNSQSTGSSSLEKVAPHAVSNPSGLVVTTPTQNNSSNPELITSPPGAPTPLELGTTGQDKVITATPIVSNNPLNSVKDSIIVAQKPTNALEKLLDEKEKKTFSEQNLNRWQVTSHLAPIYFGSLAQGSPLDPALASNTKQYSLENTSYGVGVGYAINPKVSIRTGLNVVRLGYGTDEIAYYMNTNVSSRIQNLSLNAMGSGIVIESLNNVRTYNKMTPMNRYEGSLNQRMGYLELPLEMTYRIGGKKWGINLVGGMSTYYLNQNEIYLQSAQFNMLVGEATNLNTFHFSGNLGLGIHYGFFKKWEARIEPIFKYQFNTFSADSGNFRPYMMGLYSGVSYSF